LEKEYLLPQRMGVGGWGKDDVYAVGVDVGVGVCVGTVVVVVVVVVGGLSDYQEVCLQGLVEVAPRHYRHCVVRRFVVWCRAQT